MRNFKNSVALFFAARAARAIAPFRMGPKYSRPARVALLVGACVAAWVILAVLWIAAANSYEAVNGTLSDTGSVIGAAMEP